MVSLYTADALQVNATGAHKVTTAFFDEFWKIGDIKHHATFEQVAVLNPTTATATGTWQWTGKAANGSPIDTGGYWTGVYVKDGDSWKIKMITAGVKAPPPALKADELKAEVEQILANYSVCYTKQDAACIAANYTSDGFFVNPAGVAQARRTPTAIVFKVGFNEAGYDVDADSSLVVLECRHRARVRGISPARTRTARSSKSAAIGVPPTSRMAAS